MNRISELSDELLLNILMLVPTKAAVSTSILSKRWEYLWMWLPKLDYGRGNRSDSECKRLRCFLDRNLPLHRAPVIESLRLELYSSRFKQKNITMWVLTALSHSLRELEILHEPYPETSNILPSNLYTCKSLVVLKLDGGILLDVPRMVSLPSLKTLELKSVRYFNDDATLQRLLSSCPVLEDLVVDLVVDDALEKLTVAVPSLQSLSLYLAPGSVKDGVVIETPNLKYFKLRDNNGMDQYCLIENMPYLIEAHIDVELYDVKSLIGSITSVKRLAICSQTMFDEGFAFNQLEHLEICICTTHLWNQLFTLFKTSSNLQRLVLFFIEDAHDPNNPVDDWNAPSTVPECMLSSLQSLDWTCYTGTRQEKDVASYILEHAVHLKTATITLSECEVPGFEMWKELVALSSRASTTCKLVFERLFSIPCN